MGIEIEKAVVNPTTPIKDVFNVINRADTQLALVVDGAKKLVGVTTDGDLRRAIIGNLDLDREVRHVMNPKPITARLGTPQNKIVEMMKIHSVKQIPIVDEHGIPVDIVVFSHLVREEKVIPLCEPALGNRELENVVECFRSNWVSSVGPFVDEFEEKFADFLGARHAVAICNGTAAIHSALLATGIGPGDEVLVPSLTFVATVNPILYVGAVPVFVDSEWETWNMDPDKIESKITEKTKAILPVHLYGHPANMKPIVELARKYDLRVIEDATEAMGAKCYGEKVGRIGDVSCFSFNGNKLITTGGGGMLVTDDDEIARKTRFLVNQAKEDGIEYYHSEVGYNYRLSNIQAAIGVAQLERVKNYIDVKRKNARLYSEMLHDIPGITACGEQDWAFSSFWMFSILVDDNGMGLNRSRCLKELNERGVQARPFFRPVHTLPPYLDYDSDDVTVAQEIYEKGINLPCSVSLRKGEIERIVGLIGTIGDRPPEGIYGEGFGPRIGDARA